MARQLCGDLGEVPKSRRTFGQIPLEPAKRSSFVLRRSALRVQMDELQRVLEWQVREFASGVLGQPQSAALDRSAETDVRVGLGGQERMFSCDRRFKKEHVRSRSKSWQRVRWCATRRNLRRFVTRSGCPELGSRRGPPALRLRITTAGAEGGPLAQLTESPEPFQATTRSTSATRCRNGRAPGHPFIHAASLSGLRRRRLGSAEPNRWA